MRCVRCRKPITTPAAQAGAQVWGPKCARIAGMLPPARARSPSLFKGSPRRTMADREVDPRQMSLELAR